MTSCATHFNSHLSFGDTLLVTPRHTQAVVRRTGSHCCVRFQLPLVDSPELAVWEAGGSPDAGLLHHRGHGQLHQAAEPPGTIQQLPAGLVS